MKKHDGDRSGGIGSDVTGQGARPKIAATLARLLAGAFLCFLGLLCYLESSHEGFVPALFFGLMVALGGRWVVLGILGLGRPLPPRKFSYAAALVLALVLMGAGPAASAAYYKAIEPGCWVAVKDAKEDVTWRKEYTGKVARPFRRPEYLSRQCEAICQDALRERNFHKIRFQAEKAFVENKDQYDDQARAAISSAWKELIDEGLRAIKPTKLADPRMQAAFQEVLKSLEDRPTRKIYLHFEATGSLGAIPQDKSFFDGLDPKYARLKVLSVGDAYGAEAHARRGAEVISAIQKTFDAVWPAGMLQIQSVSKAASEDDVHFWVQARVSRIPGFYTNSEKGKISSLLYKCEVAWRVRVVLQGHEAGRFQFRSEPAKHVSYTTHEGDPAWAPYSIIMDSASDNFARLIVGRLGLVPPPVRESYVFRR